MSKIEEAQAILKSLGLPRAQQNEMSALTLLALCGLRPNDQWRKARRHSVTVTNGTTLKLSPGKHNQLQAAVLAEFAPRFAPGALLVYFGDTAQKNLYVNAERLKTLHVSITEHDKLPDIVLHDENRQWLFLIEAVTSHGPMTPKRVVELQKMFTRSDVGCVYVSAFPDLAEFRRHLKQIAWETEVWIAEMPEHLIHFNGDRFLGPR